MDHEARVDILKKSGLFFPAAKRTTIHWSLRANPAYIGVHFILSLNTAPVVVFLSRRKPAIPGSSPPAPHLTLSHRKVSKRPKFLENASFLYDTALVIGDKLKRTHISRLILPEIYYHLHIVFNNKTTLLVENCAPLGY